MSGQAAATELRQIFPTILMRRRLDAIVPINGRIREIVLAQERNDPKTLGASNVGGWHSGADMTEWDYPEIRAMLAAFLEAGRDLTQAVAPPQFDVEAEVAFFGGCWANVLRYGSYNKIHNHPGAVWSGCYYVATGETVAEPAFNGWIEFQDPRPGNIHGGKERVEPEEGLLLLFPSWLNHFVNPYMGRGERISIAFNLEAEYVAREAVTRQPAGASAV